MATMSPLRQRMIEDMTIRNLSPATQQSYIYAVAKFSRYFKASPTTREEEVRAYQFILSRKSTPGRTSTRSPAPCGFSTGSPWVKEVFERIVFGKEPAKLPPVLNAEESFPSSKQ